MLFVGLLYEAFEQEVVFRKQLLLIFSNMFSENQVESYGNNFETSHHKWYPIFLTSLLALAQVQGGFSEPLEENNCGEELEQCFTFQCWWILYHYICLFDFLVLKSWLDKNSWISWPQKISKGDASPAFFFELGVVFSFFAPEHWCPTTYIQMFFLGIFRVIRKWNLLLMDHLYRFISQIGSFHVLSEGAG